MHGVGFRIYGYAVGSGVWGFWGLGLRLVISDSRFRL